jgi:hypothetical protein
VSKTRIIHYEPKEFKPQCAFTEVLVPIDPEPQALLAVVQV